MTYGELYLQGKGRLLDAGVAEAELEARLLLEFVCKTGRNDLLVHGDREVDGNQVSAYNILIGQRRERVPLQYLTGVQEFMGLEFQVDRHVLIPRQDTEILAEEVLRNLHDGMAVLDMCTGSGCILISLLHYSNNCRGVGADISEEALVMARRNAERLLGAAASDGGQQGFFGPKILEEKPGEEAITDRIRFIKSDLYEQISDKFDIIVSNPPYICSEVIDTLMPEVREYEPRSALDGGKDGLYFYRRIIEGSKKHLFGGGMLFLEIGYDQRESVTALMEQAGFLEIHAVKDYSGLDRVVYGTRGFEICR
jgi:release factor glutamine methyltransferase